MEVLTWRVDELVARRGWTVRQLADHAELDPKTVRNICAGRAKRVDLETISKLARALDVAPGGLWRTEPSSDRAWSDTAGSAGTASNAELADVLDGRWPDDADPALERATRS